MALKTWAEWQAIPQDAAGLTFPSGSPADPGSGGDIGTDPAPPGPASILLCSCFERNTGSAKGPWQSFESDGTSLGAVTGTPFDPFGPSCFGMGRLSNGRIWIAGAAYFFTCASDATDVSPTPYPGDPETPGPFHYTQFSGGQGGNYLYDIEDIGGGVYHLFEIDPTDWSDVRDWLVAGSWSFPNLGVTVGHTFAYYGNQAGPVKKIDLGTGTESTFKSVAQSGVLVFADDTILIAEAGAVKRYNASGTLLNTYSQAPYSGQSNLAHGIDGRNSFWLMGAATGTGRAHAWEFEIDTEAVLDDFEFPVYTGLRFEGPFAAIEGVPDDTPPDEEVPVHVQPPIPLCGPVNNQSTVQPNPGCNAGGVGFVNEYTGPSGVVPTVGDPTPGETLTGKRGIIIDAAIEHTSYPVGGIETLRYAFVDLDDPYARKQGRIQAIGELTHGLSDGQGNHQAATIDLQIMDAQGRPIGSRMDDATLRYFSRDPVEVHARSAHGRRIGLSPRMLARGIVTAQSYGTPVVAEIVASDGLTADGGSFGPDKKVPQFHFPWSYYFNGPPDITRLCLPIILGEVSDEGAIDPTSGLVNSRGKCPWTSVGMDGLATGPGASAEQWGRGNVCLYAAYKIIAVYGSDLGGMGLYGRADATSDGASPSVITLGGSPDLSPVPTDGSAQIVFFTPAGIEKGIITAVAGSTVTVQSTIDSATVTNVNWYISPTDYQPRRIKIDLTTRNGIDCMVPKWPGYVRSLDFEYFVAEDQDWVVTDCWFRGPLLDAHLSGECTIALNVIGVEEVGDGTGRPLTDYFTAYCWFMDNVVHKQRPRPPLTSLGGFPNWPQTDSQVPQFSDGISKTKQSSFAEAQARTATALGGDGLKVSAYFADGISIRDALQLWDDNGACRHFIDEYGRYGVWVFDDTEDPSTWPRVEHVSRVFGDVRIVRVLDEIQNVTLGSCDWDPDGQKYRAPVEPIVYPDAIEHNKGIRKLSKHYDGKLIADTTMFQWVLGRHGQFVQDGPVYVSIANCDIGVLDYPAGSGIQFTSIMGPGANGWINRPLIILRKTLDFDSLTVTLQCLDVSDYVVAIEQQAIVTETGEVPIVTEDAATTMVVTG